LSRRPLGKENLRTTLLYCGSGVW